MTMGTPDVPARRWRRPPGRRPGVAALTLATLAPAVAAAVGLGVTTAPAAQAEGEAPGCTTVGLATTCTFNYSGGYQTWTVPDGVRRVTFTVIGAAGGDTHFGRTYEGGRGGGVISTLNVTPGDVLRIYLGGRGHDDLGTNAGRGGWNGGGNGAGANNPYGGGGGGASDVRVAPYGPNDRILVGGGGGGAGASLCCVDVPGGYPGPGGSGGGSLGNGYQGMNVSGASVGAGGGGGGTQSGPGFGGGKSAGILYGACYNPDAGVAGDPGSGASGGAGAT
jgi:Glycine rich protein